MKSSFFKFFIGWPLSILALYFVFKLTATNFSDIVESFQKADIQLLFWGTTCFVIYFFLRSYIWKKILEEYGQKVPFSEVFFLWSMSELKRYIPGNIWSYLARASAFSDKNIDRKTLFPALFTEAQLLLLSAFVLAVCALPFITTVLLPDMQRFSFLFPLLYLLALSLSGVYIYGKKLSKLISKNKRFFDFILPQFSPKTNALQLGISLINTVFFGLGTYLTISSVVYLDPRLVVGFTTFFIFTYFVGYVSFITPMGLGVREGVISLGLSRMLSLKSAGGAAFFARVIFILGELIALFLSYFLYTLTKKSKKPGVFLKKYSYEIVLGFFILLYICYFTTASFLRYDNFFTGRFDLGNMAQTVWNTTHGRIFIFTNPDGTNPISRLAFHADFILILLAPIYTLFPFPKTLLFLQTVVLGMGAIFVYLIGKKILNNKSLSLTLAFLYLLNPAVGYTNLYDFHAVTFATTFLLAAYYFVLQKKYVLFILFALLSALSKEQIWAIFALFGVMLFVIQKKRIFGSIVFLFGLGMFYYLISYLIPHTRGGEHFALSYYSDFGSTPTDIIKNIIFSPIKTVSILLQPAQMIYLKQLFFPLAFLPFLAPLVLLFAAPDFVISLLSSNAPLHQIYYQYSATITPFLFISATYGILHLKKKLQFPAVFIISLLLFFGIYSAYDFGPLPFARNPNTDMFTRTLTEGAEIDAFLSRIPKRYSVAATNNLGSHLSQRQLIYTIPLGMENADVIVFLLGDPFAQPSPIAQKSMIVELKNSKKYVLIKEKNDFYAFKKIGVNIRPPKL